MKQWEQVEGVLLEYDFSEAYLTNEWLSQALGVTTSQASRMIQSYLIAQRSVKSQTGFVLKRAEGRTTSSQWSVGQRIKDARQINRMFADDVKCKLKRAVEPDLLAIARINPRAVPQIEMLIDVMGDGFMKVLEVAVSTGHITEE